MWTNNTKTALVAVACLAALALGCDGDEFDDAQAVTAGEASQAQPSGDDSYGEQPTEQGMAYDSPGPVNPGAQRPADHPTMQQDQQGGGQRGGSMNAPAPNVDRPAPDDYGQAGPIRWQAPEQWEPQPPSNQMRFAEYQVPGDDGSEPAELTVFYFGPEGGGGAEATLNRWAGEFSGGSDPVLDQREIDGMTVHTIEVDGTRQPSMAMGAGGGPTEDQQLLGAVAETSDGLFFFRLVGDQEVVGAETEQFDAFVNSFEDGR